MSGGGSSLIPTFQQQGTVDWTALTGGSWNLSIAILGRLSAAGLDPLTIVVGQSLFAGLPIGPYGETVVTKAVVSLKAFSTFGDLIWFGTGVRHVLRIFVQNSHGLSLCGFCAALSQGFSSSYAALVLHEMFKLRNGPSALSPSLAQWETLIEVCAPILMGSKLSLKYAQFLRLGGFKVVQGEGPYSSASEDLAQTIIGIGKVLSGELESITILGGGGCAWVAALCDEVLGLRIVIESDAGIVYKSALGRTQITICFSTGGDSRELMLSASTYILPTGTMLSVINRHGLDDPSLGCLDSRLNWESALSEYFGTQSQMLFDRGSFIHRIFIKLFTLSAVTLYRSRSHLPGTSEPREFLLRSLTLFRELEELRADLLGALARVIGFSQATAEMELSKTFEELCLYKERRQSMREEDELSEGNMCSTIIVLAHILSRLSFDSPLSLSRLGVYMVSSQLSIDLRGLNRPYKLLYKIGAQEVSLRKYLTLTTGNDDPFAMTVALFTGRLPKGKPLPIRTAMAENGIYCYRGILQGLSDDYEQVTQIHIGAGSIEANDRQYKYIQDNPEDEEKGNLVHRPHHLTSRSGKDALAELFNDYSSKDLRVVGVVNQSVSSSLNFTYRCMVKRECWSIQPLEHIRVLYLAQEYQSEARIPVSRIHEDDDADRVLALVKQNLEVAKEALLEAEAIVVAQQADCQELASTRPIFRPCYGNSIARCLSLRVNHLERPKYLVDCEDDIELILRHILGERIYEVNDLDTFKAFVQSNLEIDIVS